MAIITAADIASARTTQRVVLDLARRDYQQQYQGTYLGFVWMFAQPLLFILVLYTIFTLGLRAQQTVDMPFGLYLISGMICWTYFSGNLSSTAGVIKAHAYLVKKVDVRLSILPLVKVLSSLLPHLFLLAVAVALAWWQGYRPSWYTFQILYYLAAMAVLLVGVGWITSSTTLFVKDVGNIVVLVVQFGFWLTPIFWNIAMIPERFQWIVKLNPIYYLVTGYRDSIVLRVPFWERAEETTYYWLLTLAVVLLGGLIFRRLRPHFAEVI